MSTRSAAARRPPSGRHAAPRPVAPRAPRRVSGPAHPARPAHPAARPAGRPARQPTGALERLRAVPDGRVLDRLLRSRACIWVIAVALLGLVAVQVSLLKLNTGISRAVQASATLERQNAALEDQIGRLAATEKVRMGAVTQGMLTPLAGDVEYLSARPALDAQRAIDVMRPPSEAAEQLMAAGGILPTTAATAADAITDPAAAAPGTTTPAPAEADAAATTAAAPVATATPAPVAPAEPASAEPATGGAAAVAGQG